LIIEGGMTALRKVAFARTMPIMLLAASSDCGSTKATPTSLLIHDTTGAQYLYVCDSGSCSIKPTASTPHVQCVGNDGGIVDGPFSYAWGRFFSIMIFGPASLQRPVACSPGETCPTAPDGTSYTCIHGLCQKPGSTGTVVPAFDAINLCQAGDPWPSDCGTAFLADPAYGAAANKVFAACPAAAMSPTPPPEAGVAFGNYDPNAMCPVPPSCLQP
jgi:hypothetical protein